MNARIIKHVAQRLGAILRRPDGWGPPHAVELQVLLLVEVWHVAHAAPQEQVDGTSRRYDRYLGEVLPGPPWPLAARLGLGLNERANDEFVKILCVFLERETGHKWRGSRVRRSVREQQPPKAP